MNECGACHKDFSSLRGFDAHRVGQHEHLFSEQHPEGRRCLSADELRAKGYAPDARGRWGSVAAREKARVAFRGDLYTSQDTSQRVKVA